MYPFGKCDKEGDAMRKKVWTILVLAVGMLLAAGFPFPTVTSVQADPGCGKGCPRCGCECDGPRCAGQAVPPCMQDNAAAVPGGMHRRMHCGGGPSPMMGGMARPVMEEMRGTIAKLRALEAKMEALSSKDDAAAFRAASLEHSKLLTDLQASHLKHMEGMMGSK